MSTAHCHRLVLVVDDDDDIRDTIAELLADEGYVVRTAVDGNEALDVLRTSEARLPCVILLDLMMPRMSGTAFCAAQSADPDIAAIPVVLISAHANLSAKAATLGHPYVSKPLRVEQLLEVVERHCA
jgi:CheY-like chemotaxis protein